VKVLKRIWSLASGEVKIIVVLLVAIYLWMSYSNSKISALQETILSYKQPGLRSVTIEGNEVTEDYGSGQVTYYRPPEGKILVDHAKYKAMLRKKLALEIQLEILRKEGDPDTSKTIEEIAGIELPPLLRIERRGFCLKPFAGYGLTFARDVGATWEPSLGLKLVFWDRWNCGLGASPSLMGINVGFHPPISLLGNLEFSGTLGLHREGRFGVAMGLKIDL